MINLIAYHCEVAKAILIKFCDSHITFLYRNKWYLIISSRWDRRFIQESWYLHVVLFVTIITVRWMLCSWLEVQMEHKSRDKVLRWQRPYTIEHLSQVRLNDTVMTKIISVASLLYPFFGLVLPVREMLTDWTALCLLQTSDELQTDEGNVRQASACSSLQHSTSDQFKPRLAKWLSYNYCAFAWLSRHYNSI